jgi:2,3-bisphosphoglycerate-independent phosphoglycerate mutase
MILLRGFAQLPDMPPMADVFKMRPGAVAYYPMYRGLAKLVGMTALPANAKLEESFGVVAENYDRFDFFFVHYKPADSAGEDGDFDRKVAALEAADAAIPELMALKPDVVMIAGDHSTPATYVAHSWHPVPFALWGKWCRKDDAEGFNERECQRGALGTFQATEALPMAMAHAGRFIKYGA